MENKCLNCGVTSEDVVLLSCQYKGEGVSTKLCKLINLSKHRRWTNEGRETGKDGRSKS